jgi:hypothetical protein
MNRLTHEPTHSKYVVVADCTGKKHCILFHHSLTHSRAVPFGMTPISAGYVMVWKGRIVIPYIASMTLDLGPNPGDQHLIAALINIPVAQTS